VQLVLLARKALLVHQAQLAPLSICKQSKATMAILGRLDLGA
jgi:hypothetical protein